MRDGFTRARARKRSSRLALLLLPPAVSAFPLLGRRRLLSCRLGGPLAPFAASGYRQFRSLPQAVGPVRHHPVPGIEPGVDRDLVAVRRAELDHLHMHSVVGLIA